MDFTEHDNKHDKRRKQNLRAGSINWISIGSPPDKAGEEVNP